MMIRPKSPLGLKYLQIVPGDSIAATSRPATRSRVAAARPEPVDIDEFFDMFDEHTRKAIRATRPASATPSPAAGRRSTPPSAALRRLAESAQAPLLRNLVPPSTNFGGFWRALEALSTPPSHRSPRQRRASSSPSTAPSPPSPASPAPTSRKRSPRALRPSTPRSKTCRRSTPSSILRALLHRLQPGAAPSPTSSPVHCRGAPRRHPGPQRLAGLQRPARADRRRAARLPGSARRLQRPRPADRHQQPAQPGDQLHRARRRRPATT